MIMETKTVPNDKKISISSLLITIAIIIGVCFIIGLILSLFLGFLGILIMEGLGISVSIIMTIFYIYWKIKEKD